MGLSKASKEEFESVERDLIINCAKLFKESETDIQFHLVSGFASNSNSWFYIPKIKGQCEDALMQMGLKSLFIYRPGLLRCSRKENRPLEWMARCISNWIDFKNYWSISTQDLAKVVIQVSLDTSKYSIDNSNNVTLFEHGEIARLVDQ